MKTQDVNALFLLIGKLVANQIREIRLKTSINGLIMPNYELRHVKAHSKVNDARSWVNDWCDKEAKKWMRKLVSDIQEKEKINLVS